ncbi:DUF808 domain-containing protein [Roseomonas sp. SSH11]|uniref:DUF808 domain-containing protein n=1 Tax=Pararoseomonas baculiformis TaxID=2820812 RepID=A0ABS4AN60_9PROT|nr:DUF808 domain-containing protein [Pararoseomonas baculiformis]
MSTGLIALLDDIAGLAKVAAASLDDVAAQSAKAGAKAAGVVIDDAAVTPRYVVGFAAAREVPIVAKIAWGSLKNKLLFLLPGALLLSLFAPWAITPLLMLGGAYLCYEGAEKVWHVVAPHGAGQHEAKLLAPPENPQALEDAKVRGAIGTDFILSAEIMAITLGTLPGLPLWEQAVVLAIVGIGITVGVYGVVALIVKADDAGLAMAAGERPISAVFRRRIGQPSGADLAVRPVTQAIGRGLVVGMPWFLKLLAVVGTAAMVWVGGGIIVHGLASYGLPEVEHAIHGAAIAVADAVPAMAGAVEWLATAAGSGVVGLAVGALLIPVVQLMVSPLIGLLRRESKGHGGAGT